MTMNAKIAMGIARKNVKTGKADIAVFVLMDTHWHMTDILVMVKKNLFLFW